jgi:hypothetical protein
VESQSQPSSIIQLEQWRDDIGVTAATVNVELAAQFYGLGHLAFFTLTFAKPIYSAAGAQKRLNSILTNIIRPRYADRYVTVFQRHESGAIHFHFMVYVKEDIRTGFDWDLAQQAIYAQKQRNFALAGGFWTAAADRAKNGDFLRGEWKFWREARRRYRWLGRCEMLPIRSTAKAIATYMGRYISKHMQHRCKEDKGVRLVRYGKGMRRVRSRLAFNSPRARLYRRKVAAFAAPRHIRRVGVEEYGDLKRVFGKRWAFYLFEKILAMELDTS